MRQRLPEPKWLLSRPRLALSILFLSGKIVLALVAMSSPGPGYDTSTSLLNYEETGKATGATPRALTALYKFVRWDAIYFIHIASRGHVFEQEWAFGTAFPHFVAFMSSFFHPFTQMDPLARSTAIAILVAATAHWLSVILLFELANTSPGQKERKVAFLAALLHILSPAGIFLFAPCSESLFSMLNFLGHLLYRKGTKRLYKSQVSTTDLNIVLAGLVFGLATMTRANGLLSGWPFLYDSLLLATALIRAPFGLGLVLRLICLVCGGLLVAAGMALPQYRAYQVYCMLDGDDSQRPWCRQTIPYAYGWVQEHYWDNGFFRYWTISNLPLFLLAAPMLLLLAFSAVDSLRKAKSTLLQGLANGRLMAVDSLTAHDVVRMALPQLVLTGYAFTASHVQIITRLSSGYPLLYIWLAAMLLERSDPKRRGWNERTVRFMVVYGLIQGGLYASFLPPA